MTEPPWLPVAPRMTRIGFGEDMVVLFVSWLKIDVLCILLDDSTVYIPVLHLHRTNLLISISDIRIRSNHFVLSLHRLLPIYGMWYSHPGESICR